MVQKWSKLSLAKRRFDVALTLLELFPGSHIKVEKHIPKNYQAKYKEFKSMAWKLKNMPEMNYSTQIIFDNHIMMLRVKGKDTEDEKFHWINHASFEPPMESNNAEKSTLKTPIGSKATPPPDNSTINKANSAFFMTLKGMTEIYTADTFKSMLIEYLNPEHKDKIVEVKMTKRPDLVIAYCDSWPTAKDISTNYKNKFSGHEVTFELFAQRNPTSL